MLFSLSPAHNIKCAHFQYYHHHYQQSLWKIFLPCLVNLFFGLVTNQGVEYSSPNRGVGYWISSKGWSVTLQVDACSIKIQTRWWSAAVQIDPWNIRSHDFSQKRSWGIAFRCLLFCRCNNEYTSRWHRTKFGRSRVCGDDVGSVWKKLSGEIRRQNRFVSVLPHRYNNFSAEVHYTDDF